MTAIDDFKAGCRLVGDHVDAVAGITRVFVEVDCVLVEIDEPETATLGDAWHVD